MKLNNFLNILKENQNLDLVFEFAQNQFTKANYHLTEVKNVQYSTVDCGGKPNNWKETHIQLWESPRELEKTKYLTVEKVLSIINRVNSINTLWLKTDVKIEFGNESFHTSIMDVSSYYVKENKLVIKLFSVKTQCKAISEIGKDNCCSTENSGCC